VGYYLNMLDPHFPLFYPRREVDASHPDILLDRDRCILCELCVRASRDVDGKDVFGISGRGIASHLVVNSATGLLKDTDMQATDKAATVCPVGAIIVKRHGFEKPIGARQFDLQNVGEWSLERDAALTGGEHG
jgi:[NiFe] hydrogenase diaphorase moiety small subunit